MKVFRVSAARVVPMFGFFILVSMIPQSRDRSSGNIFRTIAPYFGYSMAVILCFGAMVFRIEIGELAIRVPTYKGMVTFVPRSTTVERFAMRHTYFVNRGVHLVSGRQKATISFSMMTKSRVAELEKALSISCAMGTEIIDP